MIQMKKERAQDKFNANSRRVKDAFVANCSYKLDGWCRIVGFVIICWLRTSP